MKTEGASEFPLVSVVTPVYNGAAYIDECIKSVRQQSYPNWEYIIVNNCSTDATAKIAEAHVREDKRIRLISNVNFLPLIPNWNHALRSISPLSHYCKVVHADDLLYEDCLEKMVSVAERHPSVGVVGSYVQKGTNIVGTKFPFPDEFRPGSLVSKETLQRCYYVFGSPTSTLIRADLVRGKDAFYNEGNFHADVEVCFELLRTTDFGFVHKALTFTREHPFSQTSTIAARFKTNLIENQVAMLQRYGPGLLSETEIRQRVDGLVSRYYAELARNVGSLLEADFRQRQRDMLHRQGMRLQWNKVGKALIARAARVIAHPKGIRKAVSTNLLRRTR